jgi:hypothetical protein
MLPLPLPSTWVIVFVSKLAEKEAQRGANQFPDVKQRDCGGNITWGCRQNILCSTPPWMAVLYSMVSPDADGGDGLRVVPRGMT